MTYFSLSNNVFGKIDFQLEVSLFTIKPYFPRILESVPQKFQHDAMEILTDALADSQEEIDQLIDEFISSRPKRKLTF